MMFRNFYQKSILNYFTTLIFLLLSITSSASQAFERPDTLWEILEYYGIKNTTQKSALQALMQKSGVNANELFYKPLKNNDELLANILEFVTLTQERFSLRTGTQERWEVKPAKWMETNIDRNARELTALGLTAPIMPEFYDADVTCILGATATRMQTRIDYAARLLNNNSFKTKYLVLLAGERYVTAAMDLDGTPQDLSVLAKKLNKPVAQLTETDLLVNIYQQSSIYEKYDTSIIDVQRGDMPRPTTESTVQEFIKWLSEQPNIKRIVFVTNQPYVGYQSAVIAEVFRQAGVADKYEIDVIGMGFDILKKPDLKQVVEVAGAFGSQIYAQTPNVIDRLGLKITDPALRQKFTEYYKKQPLVYKHVEQLFAE